MPQPTVPAGQLLRDGSTKSLLRAIAARYCSGRLMREPKLYVAAPQREWMKAQLRQPIREMIQDSILAEEGYLVKDALLRQFDDYTASADLGNSFFIWKFVNLELWYRIFVADDHADWSMTGAGRPCAARS